MDNTAVNNIQLPAPLSGALTSYAEKVLPELPSFFERSSFPATATEHREQIARVGSQSAQIKDRVETYLGHFREGMKDWQRISFEAACALPESLDERLGLMMILAEDDNAGVRYHALRLMQDTGERAMLAQSLFIRRLADTDAHVARMAADLLCMLSHYTSCIPEALPALIVNSRHEDTSAAAAAIVALGLISDRSAGVLEALNKVVSREPSGSSLWQRATGALRKLESKQ